MNKLRKINRKGFTLIELIVVIVIIAILVAALTPAILGVIERANRAADEADCRTLYMAAIVAADPTGTVPPTNAQITAEINGPAPGITVDLYFQGSMCIGVSLTTGRSQNNPPIEIGDTSGTGVAYP
ncbi:MAG: prepilin-type N-terminal cleavage/methylation domain-containing protein [Oscillospiraceae bacterium]|jgi:prepilin-type N-terminal cleavage/methylation domain-containing protein|nr:prepilin-type N-terminal cleavage/methylation domain-containing protein [Oscillospiraceae bacterium]